MSSKTIKALSYLQDYADTSEKAHKELKSCIWQLTKSRRNNQSGIIGVDSTTAYTAELLREELRAQICVVDGGDEGDIKLLNEDSERAKTTDDGDLCPVAPQWKLHDVRSDIEKSIRNSKLVKSSSQDNRIGVNTPKNGVRNRNNIERNAVEETITTSLDTSSSLSWTIIQEEDFNSEGDDEERIIRTDPIKLFGGYFTARELKVAQRNAQESLIGYIHAANEAAKLLEFLRQNKD